MTRLRSSFILILVVITTQKLHGQSTEISEGKIKVRKNTIFLELYGNGYHGSINYERILPINRMGAIGLRVGIGSIHGLDNSGYRQLYPVVPLECNYIIGGHGHYMDVGIGYSHIQHYTYKYLLVYRLGYRYQSPTGRILFRFGFTPLHWINKYGPPNDLERYFGISVGTAF